MKKGELIKFPHRSAVLDEDQMIAMNFNQCIEAMIATFGPFFTKKLFKVAMQDKARKAKPTSFKKSVGE
jgi:hypothetical protein